MKLSCMQDVAELPLPDAEKILEIIFSGEWKRPSSRLRHSVNKAVKSVFIASRPLFVWRTVSIKQGNPYCLIGVNNEPLKSRLISDVLSRCDKALLCAATLGPDTDALIANPENSAYNGYILDRVASITMEACMDDLEMELADTFPINKALTARYSPGYCDWPLKTGQQLIFSILGAEKAGITITQSFLMHPRKSVTAVIGIGERSKVESYGIACRNCASVNCPNRRHKSDLKELATR